MPGSALVMFFQVVSLAGSALTVLKLFLSGLHRRYRVFFWYFLFRVADAIWPFFLRGESGAYQILWILTEPVVLVFYILVVLELYKLVLERHKGLYSLGRWAMYLGIAISVTVSAISFLPRLKQAMPQRTRVMGYVLATDRGVTFSLAIFLVLMLFLLSRYPVRLSRNIVVHAVVYTVFFLSSTLAEILHRVFGRQLSQTTDLVLMGTASACVIAWLALLNLKGEEVQLNLPHFGPEHEKQLLYQLDALNTTLLRSGRK